MDKDIIGNYRPGPGAIIIPPQIQRPTVHEIAVQAMQGMLAGPSGDTFRVREAYELAEAMIAQGLEHDRKASQERAKNA